jgi:hypothetical protein
MRKFKQGLVPIFLIFFSVCLFVFLRPDESERAMEVCQGKMFLGAEMQIQTWNGPTEKSKYLQYMYL